MKDSSLSALMDPAVIIKTIDEAIYHINTTQRREFETTGKLVTLPTAKEALILGDIHGDLRTLRQALKDTNFIKQAEEDSSFLVCLGDYIDRGPRQVEVMHFVLELLISYPSNVILLRGNHEGPRDLEVTPHDFPNRLQSKYGKMWKTVYDSFRRLFDNLFTAALVEDKAVLLHGGIPTEAESLEDIAQAHLTHPERSDLAEILWNDPSTLEGVNHSFRGTGKQFGVDVASRFLEMVGAEMLIRGHECFDEGFHFHDGRILTLFSCRLPMYRNRHAAYLNTPLDTCFSRDNLSRYIAQLR